jgi:hypothetical protein
VKRTEDEAEMQADLSAVEKKQLPHNCTNHSTKVRGIWGISATTAVLE